MTAVLLSSERWDDVWRRNQQLASRIEGTLYVEPARRGLRAHWRRQDGVAVLTPAKPLPLRWGLGRHVQARLAARSVRQYAGLRPIVTWATHGLAAPVARAIGAPMLYDRTDDWPAMESSPAARRLMARLDGELLRDAAAVVVVSEGMRAQARPDAVLIPNGVDVAAFSISMRRGSNGDRLRIAFTGTVDPFRLDFDILRALARDPDVTLVVAGPGQLIDGAENHGVIAHARLPALLAGCDGLVAPYRLDCEANLTSDALKMYEYFATGLPVLATPIAGFERYPDLVEYWPPRPSVRQALLRNRSRSPGRRAVAAQADWGVRAADMRRVLTEVGEAR